ncbi:hypothetical protein [Bradyrhizobium sp. S3.2.12]|uniref:hypothetical protein n=1 Tax=Bradyrhizobium sp. S3.2.12 TaxID=3156387 RepID=UPI0033956FD5
MKGAGQAAPHNRERRQLLVAFLGTVRVMRLKLTILNVSICDVDAVESVQLLAMNARQIGRVQVARLICATAEIRTDSISVTAERASSTLATRVDELPRSDRAL